MKVVTAWCCPTCGHRIGLRFRPPEAPRCAHAGTRDAGKRTVDMVEEWGS
jgi:DNA-directed RNA polymerase subunit RPC12/RpoP